MVTCCPILTFCCCLQVLEFLSNPGDESRHEERQQALLELLNAGGLQQFDDGRLLTLAENAKYAHFLTLRTWSSRQGLGIS